MGQFIFSFILLASSVAMYFGFIDPAYKEVQVLKTQNEEFKNAVDNAQQLNLLREGLLTELNDFPEEDVARLSTLVPDHIDHIRLIVEINQIAKRHNSVIRNVTIQGVGENNQTTAPGTISSSEGEYESVILNFNISGTYQTLKEFLKDIEDNLHVADVTSLKFSSSGTDIYQFSVALKTYWLASE